MTTKTENETIEMYCIEQYNEHFWRVSFVYSKKNSRVYAINLDTRQKLVAPNDTNEIAKIVPLEMWPAFAKSIGEANTQKEGLF